MPYDPTTTSGTPYLAPLVPTLPIQLRRTEVLTVVYDTDESAAAALIPQPLELMSSLCIVHVYWMHDADWFGVYGESAVQLPVRMPDGQPAVYSTFLVLDSDGAVAAGRELYGQPKKSGTVTLGPEGDLLVGRVVRNTIDVITATMAWKQQRATSDSIAELIEGAGTNVNLRVMPDGAGGYRRELIARDFVDVVTHECWVGEATIELRPNAQVPVHRLPVRNVRLGVHRVFDITLAPGRSVHRYPDSA